MRTAYFALYLKIRFADLWLVFAWTVTYSTPTGMSVTIVGRPEIVGSLGCGVLAVGVCPRGQSHPPEEDQPGRISLHVCWRVPMRDSRSLLVHDLLPSHCSSNARFQFSLSCGKRSPYWCQSRCREALRMKSGPRAWPLRRVYTHTVLPRCYALLAVTPPPLFSGEITV